MSRFDDGGMTGHGTASVMVMVANCRVWARSLAGPRTEFQGAEDSDSDGWPELSPGFKFKFLWCRIDFDRASSAPARKLEQDGQSLPGVRAAAAVAVSSAAFGLVIGPGPAEPRPPCLVAPPLGQSPASHCRLGSVAQV